MRLRLKTVLPLAAGRAGSAKDYGSPVNGLPFLFHLFNQSLHLLLLDVSCIFHQKKNCGQMVGLPVTVSSLCLEAYPTLSPQLENEVAVPVQVCKPLKLCPGIFRVLYQGGIDKVSHLLTLVDVKSPEAPASIVLCISQI